MSDLTGEWWEALEWLNVERAEDLDRYEGKPSESLYATESRMIALLLPAVPALLADHRRLAAVEALLTPSKPHNIERDLAEIPTMSDASLVHEIEHHEWMLDMAVRSLDRSRRLLDASNAEYQQRYALTSKEPT